jgi:hypothetical protein
LINECEQTNFGTKRERVIDRELCLLFLFYLKCVKTSDSNLKAIQTSRKKKEQQQNNKVHI